MRWNQGQILEERLGRLQAQARVRTLSAWQHRQGVYLQIAGRTLLNACSNDYLGLADSPGLAQAMTEGIQRWGVGAGASRLVSGNHTLYTQLEHKLAQWTGRPAALVFGSGYLANAGIIPALVGRGDVVFCDRCCHASIYDGIALSGARLLRFPHNDSGALEKLLADTAVSGRKLMTVESVYSMDGDRCPLLELYRLADAYDALLYVDEAHAFGTLGTQGRGITEHLCCDNRIDLQIGTLGKAFGCYGAFVAGEELLIRYLISRCRTLIFATALPPAVLAAAMTALDLIAGDHGLLNRLRQVQTIMSKRLGEITGNSLSAETPIFPVVLGEAEKALEVSRRMREAGVLAPAIRPPTVPENTARLRITACASYTDEDLELFTGALRAALKA